MADLLQDHGALAVGHGGIDLDAAIDRAGVHDDRIGPGPGQALLGESVALEVFVFARQQGALHALFLQAQHHHGVHPGEARVHIVADLNAELFRLFGDQGGRPDDPDLQRAERAQRVDLRARHPRVQHIANDRHAQVFKAALVLAQGKHVQHGLGRMRMAPVARVDHADMRRGPSGDVMRGPAFAMADDKHIAVHRLQRLQGVAEALSLALGRGGDIEVDNIRREALGGQFKGGAGAGAGFKKQVGNGAPAQQRDFFDWPPGHAGKGGRVIKDFLE